MTNQKLKDFVSDTREELGSTLDEIETRLSPQHLSQQFTQWVSASYDRNPVRWLIGIAATVVAGVAAVLWAILGEDD
jgi:septation ring formation regulator EzrA